VQTPYIHTECSKIEIAFKDDFKEVNGKQLPWSTRLTGVEVIAAVPDKFIVPANTANSAAGEVSSGSNGIEVNLDATNSSAMNSGANSTPFRPELYGIFTGANSLAGGSAHAHSPTFSDTSGTGASAGTDWLAESIASSDRLTSPTSKLFKDVCGDAADNHDDSDLFSGCTLFNHDSYSFGHFNSTSSSSVAAAAVATDNSFNMFGNMTNTSATAAAATATAYNNYMLTAPFLNDPAAAVAAAAAEPAAVENSENRDDSAADDLLSNGV
jgi:hypothetical protein